MAALYFVVHTINHARLIARTVLALRERGLQAHVVDLLDIGGKTITLADECRHLGIPSRPAHWLRSTIAEGDFIVTCCDWVPLEFVALLRNLKARGIGVIGLLEGSRWSMLGRYLLVDRVLAYGPSAREAFAEPVHVVGSPVIERTLALRPKAVRDLGYVLVNYKDLQRESSPALEAWLTSVLRVCDAAGLETRVTVHPRMKVRPTRGRVAGETFADLIHGASALVSMASTVILEALACGRPVVLFPNGDEPLLEFAEPQGAFEIATSEEALSWAIATALRPDPVRQQRAGAFLARQVSIEPGRPAWLRLADALEEIAMQPGRQPAGVSRWPQIFTIRFFGSNTGLRLPHLIQCRPGRDAPGHCLFGPNFVIPETGRYRATFEFESTAGGTSGGPVISLDVFANQPEERVLAERPLDSLPPGGQAIALDFTARHGQRIEFRVYWHGSHGIVLRRVRCEPAPLAGEEPAPR